MKISYERLNQIIEEEVSRFKRLNEIDGTTAPQLPSDPGQAVGVITGLFNQLLKDKTKYQAVYNALNGIK